MWTEIRFTTSHPFEFKDDLIETYDRVPELVSHVHLPVQSGSDRILKLMRRRYDIKQYYELVDKIVEVRPEMKFSSDFIVGFPGETDEDFIETMSVVEKIRFDESFSFIYSPRPNTPAAQMEDNVSDSIKKERLQELQVKTLLFFKWLQQENGRNFPKNSCYGCFKKRSRTTLWKDCL